MHSFVFIAIFYNELYGQKHLSHNDQYFQDGLKTEFQDQPPYITKDFAKILFFIILNKYLSEAFIFTYVNMNI